MQVSIDPAAAWEEVPAMILRLLELDLIFFLLMLKKGTLFLMQVLSLKLGRPNAGAHFSPVPGASLIVLLIQRAIA